MTRKTAIAIALSSCALIAGFGWFHEGRSGERAEGRMSQEVYVWQRVWTEPVLHAVVHEATNFSRIVPLAAEVTWNQGELKVARAGLNFEALRLNRQPIGLALRIGPFSGPFVGDDSRAQVLTSLAASLIEEAETNQLNVSELQIDFDCAASKLDGYRLWVESIRQAVAPCPVVITA